MPTARCTDPSCTWSLWLDDERQLARAILAHRMQNHPLMPSGAEFRRGAVAAVDQRETYGKRDAFGIAEVPAVRGVKRSDVEEVDVERLEWERRQALREEG